MINHYTIVRYVPDPIADERMNIGVLVFAGDRVRAKFADDWRRVQSFGKEGVDFLKGFADRMMELIERRDELPGLFAGPSMNEAMLRKMISTWERSIQFSEPRASEENPDQLLTYLESRFLASAQPRQYSQSKRVLVQIARDKLTSLLSTRLGVSAGRLVRSDAQIKGLVEDHPFDIAIMNGEAYLAVQCFSFETHAPAALKVNFEAMAYALEDVRQNDQHLPLAVLSRPPQGRLDIYDRAKRVCRQLNASMLTEEAFSTWGDEKIETLKLLEPE